MTVGTLPLPVDTGSSDEHLDDPDRRRVYHSVPYADFPEPVDGTFLPVGELQERLDAAGTPTSPRATTNCGGGICWTAVALALAPLGRDDAAVYDGSMLERSAEPSLPVEWGTR